MLSKLPHPGHRRVPLRSGYESANLSRREYPLCRRRLWLGRPPYRPRTSARQLVETHAVDLLVINGENAAGGFGITPAIAEELFDLGAHVITTGNHIWDKREIFEYMAVPSDSHARGRRILRPANYAVTTPGFGMYQGTLPDGQTYAIMNMQGRVFMSSCDDPFRKADELLSKITAKVILLDFHAEATSEKVAMGWYLDGRVTAVLGTHTHVPTADERILLEGTAYQTDVGMSGPYDSVIGGRTRSCATSFSHRYAGEVRSREGQSQARRDAHRMRWSDRASLWDQAVPAWRVKVSSRWLINTPESSARLRPRNASSG